MHRSPKCLVSLLLILTGCALPPTRSGDTSTTLLRERQEAAIAQARIFQLEAEIVTIRAKLAERDRLDLELRREQIQMAERLDRLLELQQRTYQAVSENTSSIGEYKDLPAPNPRQLETRNLVRNIERLSLNPEQKQTIIQMLRPPRQLDGNNPWGNGTEWR
jgi:hypothetical protein